MKQKMLLLAVAVMASSMLSIGCTPKGLVKTEYIKPTVPPLPPKPNYYPVKFKSVEWDHGKYDYCLDEQGAKNFLKNKALQDDREKDLEEIIEGMR